MLSEREMGIFPPDVIEFNQVLTRISATEDGMYIIKKFDKHLGGMIDAYDEEKKNHKLTKWVLLGVSLNLFLMSIYIIGST